MSPCMDVAHMSVHSLVEAVSWQVALGHTEEKIFSVLFLSILNIEQYSTVNGTLALHV